MKNLTFFNKIIKYPLFRVLVIAVLALIGYEATRYVAITVYQKIKESFFPDEDEFKPFTVEAENVRYGSIVRTITLPGRLVANQKVVLRPEVEGKLKVIHFDGGQAVKKGDPLYELDDHVFKAQLKEGKAKLVLAKQELDRASRLAEKSAGTLKQKEKAQADFFEAEANVEINQHRVDNTIIRAPFDGYVGINNVSIGSFVNQQTELATVVDSDPMKIDFRIPARYMKQISVGQRVTLLVDGFDDKEFPAEIVNIDAKIEDNVHSAIVRASISNPRNFLKSGVFCRVKVVVGSKDNVLLVPRDAVKSSADEEYVFRVYTAQTKSGKTQSVALKTPVVTGLESGETVEVTRGLKEAMQVITIGLDKIRNGFPVTIVNENGTAGAANPDITLGEGEELDDFIPDEDEDEEEEEEEEDDEDEEDMKTDEKVQENATNVSSSSQKK